jgi:hypothetical protein
VCEGGAQAIAEQIDDRLLAIYLNDHLAGATAGAHLATRMAGANRDYPRYGPPFAHLASEIREDRRTLEELMVSLDVGVDRAKQLGAWAAEKVGRLKLNGRLLGYSPLSRVVELEVLRLGVSGKRMLWVALQSLASRDDRLTAAELDRLLERADRQLDLIEQRHRDAIADAFIDPPPRVEKP